MLNQVRKKLPVSLHSTAMGLGSIAEIPASYLKHLKRLTENIDPFLMYEHASFSWELQQGALINSGDLLPITHTHENLKRMCEQVDKVQSFLGRRLIIEKVSSYRQFDKSELSEPEFLTLLCQKTSEKHY